MVIPSGGGLWSEVNLPGAKALDHFVGEVEPVGNRPVPIELCGQVGLISPGRQQLRAIPLTGDNPAFEEGRRRG
jgi:hypothetical protein